MKASLVRPAEPPAPLAPLAPLAPDDVTVEESPPHPDAASIATTAPPSARYEHLPHTSRLKVAPAPAVLALEEVRLRPRDSNPEFLLQRQACCHYTRPQ